MRRYRGWVNKTAANHTSRLQKKLKADPLTKILNIFHYLYRYVYAYRQILNVWFICLHLGSLADKCRSICHTFSVQKKYIFIAYIVSSIVHSILCIFYLKSCTWAEIQKHVGKAGPMDLTRFTDCEKVGEFPKLWDGKVPKVATCTIGLRNPTTSTAGTQPVKKKLMLVVSGSGSLVVSDVGGFLVGRFRQW